MISSTKKTVHQRPLNFSNSINDIYNIEGGVSALLFRIPVRSPRFRNTEATPYRSAWAKEYYNPAVPLILRDKEIRNVKYPNSAAYKLAGNPPSVTKLEQRLTKSVVMAVGEGKSCCLLYTRNQKLR
mmetsp:Transcript_9158/g.11430  ORF Transcript_9158/g.11430 Transcript_9158/m.11430 type:complete len:127 (-) Transcript_9158:375-755(-)